MLRIIYLFSILIGVIVAALVEWEKEKERAEMQRMISDMIQSATPKWIAPEYLSRIEKASVEIMSQAEPVDKIIVLWWGLDGLRMNEDGSLEWISRKEPEKKSVNQNLSMAHIINPLDMRNMCQSTRAQIEELQAKIDAFKMENSIQQINTQVIAQMQLPPLQTIYPAYMQRPQYPYPPYFQGNLTGCCCDGSIWR